MKPGQTHCYFRQVNGEWLLLYANCEPREVIGADAGGVWVENRVAVHTSRYAPAMAQEQADLLELASSATRAAVGEAFGRGYMRAQRDASEAYEPIIEQLKGRTAEQAAK